MRSTAILRLSQHLFSKTKPPQKFHILPEVEAALRNGQAVVALESTILSHGLPYPENQQLSQDISTIIRSKGGIPATIAVKNGVCQIGLSQDDIHDLVRSGMEGRATKCSTRDLPFLLAHNNETNENISGHQWGATTVASTMRLAHLAGISTFVTGGTGGVHRGAEITMDISADLIELSRTPLVVVSAGVKSILDIRKTLETLETYSVPTASFQTSEFPAFFSPTSGIRSPMRVDSAEEVANAYLESLNLGLPSGMLVAVPNYDPAGANVERAILETIDEANKLAIEGRDVTPYILKTVSEKTDGDSLRSNTALVKRNAEVGTDIAISIAEQKNQGDNYSIYMNSNNGPNQVAAGRVIVVGGTVVDMVAKSNDKIIPATSNPGSCSESDGGVGRNIADVLGQLGAEPIIFTAVGDDSRGRALRQRMEDEYDIPQDRQHIKVVPESNTATYLAILDHEGDLHAAIADMDVLKQIPLPDESLLSSADYMVIDANLPLEKLIRVTQSAKNMKTKVVFDPTSVPKASLLKGNNDFLKCLSFTFPNVDELLALVEHEHDPSKISKDYFYRDDFKVLKQLVDKLLETMHPQSAHVIVTLGSRGALIGTKESTNRIYYTHFQVESIVHNIENCTGAGDTMVGMFVKSLLDGKTVKESLRLGMTASVKSIQYADGAIPKF